MAKVSFWLGFLVWSGAALGDLGCLEKCQYWDASNEACDYRTYCGVAQQMGNLCVTTKTCARFDAVNHSCALEAESTQCQTHDPAGSLPLCRPGCQYFNTAENHCDYMTRCETGLGCLAYTSCEYWNATDRACRSETRSLTCI